MKKTILLTALFLSAASQASAAAQFLPVFQADMRAGGSSLADKTSTMGVGSLLGIPALKFSENDLLLPVVMVNFSGQQNAIEEETFFAQRAMGVFKPMFNHKFSPRLTGKFRLEYKQSLNKQTLDETWFKGFYDYQQYAAGVEVRETGLPILFPSALGVDVLHQSYTNFHELGVTGGKNYYTKDFDGIRFNLGAEAATPLGVSLTASYNLQLKSYTDNYLIRQDGTLNLTTLRSDSFHLIQAEGAWSPGAAAVLSLGLEGTINQSNQSYFDQDFNLYLPLYYDYNSVSVEPSFSWFFQKSPTGHRVTLGYGALFRQYQGRRIRWADGTYTEGMQSDVEQTVRADAHYSINRNFDVVAGAKGLFVTSNQEYVTGLRAAYTLVSGSLGLQYRL